MLYSKSRIVVRSSCEKERLSAQHLKQKKQDKRDVKLSKKIRRSCHMPQVGRQYIYMEILPTSIPSCASTRTPVKGRGGKAAVSGDGNIFTMSMLRFERCVDQLQGMKVFHRLPSGATWSESGEKTLGSNLPRANRRSKAAETNSPAAGHRVEAAWSVCAGNPIRVVKQSLGDAYPTSGSLMRPRSQPLWRGGRGTLGV